MAASAGLLMTLLYVVMSVFPNIDLPNPLQFTLKVAGVLGALQCAGWAYYRRATRYRVAV